MARTEDSHLAKQASQALPGGDGPAPEAADSALPEPYPAVIVRNETPALGIARCVRLSSANPVLPLLPQDPRRRHALVLAVDNDVYICTSPDLAWECQDSTTASDGFYLPKGVAVAVINKAAHWAACTTTGSASRISVLINQDDE
jgi:hypothetical protein